MMELQRFSTPIIPAYLTAATLICDGLTAQFFTSSLDRLDQIRAAISISPRHSGSRFLQPVALPLSYRGISVYYSKYRSTRSSFVAIGGSKEWRLGEAVCDWCWQSVLFLGAEGGTRTPTDYSTRPSNVRVCQFRHLGRASVLSPY